MSPAGGRVTAEEYSTPAATAAAPVVPRRVDGWHRTFASLANRDFRRLLMGAVLNVAGFQMQAIAQGYLVYELTGSAKILGLIGAGMALPILTLAPLGGAIADRVARKRLIQIGQGLLAVATLLIAVAIVTGNLIWPYLLIMAVIQGTAWSFSGPARQALLPQLVERHQLGNAVALISAGMSAPMLVAPAIAGALYALVGPASVYFLVTGLGIAAVVLTTSMKEMGRPTERPRTRVIADIGEGLSYVWRHPTLRPILAILMVFVLLSAPLMSLLPVLVIDVYHREAGALGLLVSAMGIGSLSGALIIASLQSGRRGLLLIAAGFASAAVLVTVAFAPFYAVAVVVLVVLGLANSGQWSLGQVLIMDQVDDAHRGRVMSVNMMIFGLMPFAVLPAALAADIVGTRLVMGVAGGAMLIFAVLVLLTQTRVRRIP